MSDISPPSGNCVHNIIIYNRKTLIIYRQFVRIILYCRRGAVIDAAGSRLQVGGLFLAEKAGQDAGPLVLAAHRHLVFALAGTLAGPLLAAAGCHRQRGRSVRYWWRWLLERIDVRVHCKNLRKNIITLVLFYRNSLFIIYYLLM